MAIRPRFLATLQEFSEGLKGVQNFSNTEVRSFAQQVRERDKTLVKYVDDALEHLRKGTVETFVSDWTLIKGYTSTGVTSPSTVGETVTFIHQLDDIPCVVDVLRSETADGKLPTVANSDVTVLKSDASGTRGTESTTITVTNDTATDYYFQVRAF